MTRWFLSVTFALTVATGAVAAGKGPEIDLVDNKLSVDAEAVSLGRLLQLFDMATGMKSKVPAELANRNLSVKFSGLGVTDGVRKIFQGQPLDYVMIEGQGIFVTALSQAPSASDSAAPAAYTPPPQPQPFEQPVLQEFPPPMIPGQQPQQQQQPATIQTPFGPIANPRIPAQTQQQTMPGAPIQQQPQNSLFPQSLPGQPQTAPTFPGAQPGNNQSPFGAPSPFGTPNAPQNNQNNLNNMFGTPTIFNGSPGTQPR